MPRKPYIQAGSIGKYVPTYRDFKKNVRQYIEESNTNEVTIFRERRGEWGEWFERWELIQGKPKITKQGWM
jgi:hypothetical protein